MIGPLVVVEGVVVTLALSPFSSKIKDTEYSAAESITVPSALEVYLIISLVFSYSQKSLCPMRSNL